MPCQADFGTIGGDFLANFEAGAPAGVFMPVITAKAGIRGVLPPFSGVSYAGLIPPKLARERRMTGWGTAPGRDLSAHPRAYSQHGGAGWGCGASRRVAGMRWGRWWGSWFFPAAGLVGRRSAKERPDAGASREVATRHRDAGLVKPPDLGMAPRGRGQVDGAGGAW